MEKYNSHEEVQLIKYELKEIIQKLSIIRREQSVQMPDIFLTRSKEELMEVINEVIAYAVVSEDRDYMYSFIKYKEHLEELFRHGIPENLHYKDAQYISSMGNEIENFYKTKFEYLTLKLDDYINLIMYKDTEPLGKMNPVISTCLRFFYFTYIYKNDSRIRAFKAVPFKR